MLHCRARHPVRVHYHCLETLFMNCPLDEEAYNGLWLEPVPGVGWGLEPDPIPP